MYGKLFSQMYTGSMMGSGALMFAVWPYIISNMKPNRERTRFTVELNSNLISILIGESAEDIEGIIQKCCEPDPKSRTPDKEGRKLMKIGAYLYEVVNGPIYDQMRRAEDLRESNRIRQERFYNKKKSEGAETEEPKIISKRFQKPTQDELVAEGLSPQEAVKFMAFYESCGWKVGKKPMVKWKGAVVGWKARQGDFSASSNGNHSPKRLSEMTKEDEAAMIREAQQ